MPGLPVDEQLASAADDPVTAELPAVPEFPPADLTPADLTLAVEPVVPEIVLPGPDGIAATDAPASAGDPDGLGEVASAEVVWLESVGAGLIERAASLRIGLASAAGMTVALACCAAAWFSAGTRADIIRGVAALWAGYLVLKTGYRLDRRPRERSERLRRAAVPARWLAMLGSTTTECLAYAGLAAGAAADHWSGVWALAIATLGLTGVRNMMTACSVPPGIGDHPSSLVSRVSAAALTMPTGGRILLVGVVAPIWGARAALFALVDWSVVAIVFGLPGRVRLPGQHSAGQERGADPGGADPGGLAADDRAWLVRLRDDGALARALGRLVRGTLVPLPPAVLGLLAVSALGVLGLHGLPTVLMIAPVLVLLLAAPGSSHPHSGRLDWLVPPLLLGSQVCYLVAVGRGSHVPGPVTFALVSALMLHYTELACPSRPVLIAPSHRPGPRSTERGSGPGWEGRLLVAGLAAAAGLATPAFLILTAYLVGLIVMKAVTRSVLATG